MTLVVRWNDTKGDTVTATRAMTDMICDGVSAFFGPEGTCHVEAIVAQSRNIPMISYVCHFVTCDNLKNLMVPNLVFLRNALTIKRRTCRRLPEPNRQIPK